MTRGQTAVCLAGATGWAGSELARGIAGCADLTLVAAVSRRHAGRDLGDVLGQAGLTCPIYVSAVEALARPCDVFVEYTKPDQAKANVLAALDRSAHVVVGTSGLTDGDYAEIDTAARRQKRGVLAVGNFALTMVLMQRFAEMAAKWIPQCEIIDYAHADKVDAPSGTVRELANRLSRVTETKPSVHSVRLPGFVIGAEVIFGLPDQRLSLRHDAGSSARPYVDGALLAIRRVSTLVGVHRGLDTVLD